MTARMTAAFDDRHGSGPAVETVHDCHATNYSGDAVDVVVMLARASCVMSDGLNTKCPIVSSATMAITQRNT